MSRFRCRCKDLLKAGHDGGCHHVLFSALEPVLSELGFNPHTYPNKGMPYTSDSRYSKRDGDSTLFIDIYPWLTLPPHRPTSLELVKWREAHDEQGCIKTTYGRFELKHTRDIAVCKDYFLNHWEVTLLNKQSDWEKLFLQIEKER